MKRIGIIIAVLVIFGLAGVFAVTNAPTKNVEPEPLSVSQSPSQAPEATFTYEGKEGQDALTLMKEKAAVEQNSAGLVVSINGRKADDSKKEFWAFYVNGEMASVGPAEYVTKDSDRIEWKIERY